MTPLMRNLITVPTLSEQVVFASRSALSCHAIAPIPRTTMTDRATPMATSHAFIPSHPTAQTA